MSHNVRVPVYIINERDNFASSTFVVSVTWILACHLFNLWRYILAVAYASFWCYRCDCDLWLRVSNCKHNCVAMAHTAFVSSFVYSCSSSSPSTKSRTATTCTALQWDRIILSQSMYTMLILMETALFFLICANKWKLQFSFHVRAILRATLRATSWSLFLFFLLQSYTANPTP